MARTFARYMSPEDEEALLYGPPRPPVHPNPGVAPVPKLPIDMTTPRRTDGDYSGFRDPYQDQEPTEEELAADLAHEGEEEQVAPVAGERVNTVDDEPEWVKHVVKWYPDGSHDELDSDGVVRRYRPGSEAQKAEDLAWKAKKEGGQGAAPGLDIFLTDVANAANPYEEEAQSYAAAQKAAAPRAVDNKAASVADEQKGVPAAPVIGARTEAQVERMRSETPASAADHTDEGERFYKDAGKGSGFLGVGDLPNFRDDKIRRVQEAYGDESAPNRFWEDEFLRDRKRVTDKDVHRAFVLQSLMQGTEHGMKFREMMRGEQQSFDEGLEKARAKDFGNRRISRGMAEAIAASGQMSPEGAAQLRANDEAVKYFGQYASQGGRYEGQQIGLRKNQNDAIVKMAMQGAGLSAQQERAFLNAYNQLDLAEARGVATLPTEEQTNAAASLMEQALSALGNIPSGKGIGLRALQGDLSGLSEEQQELAARIGPQLIARARSKQGLSNVIDDSLKTQATQKIKDSYSIAKSLEMARNNNKAYRTKFKNDWDSAAIAFRDAWTSWDSLDNDAKQRFAQWSAGGFTGDVLKFIGKHVDGTPDAEEQEKFAALRGVINALVKDRSGSAVTGSEWERIAVEIGLEPDNWGPFNSAGTVTKWLRRTGNTLESHRENFEDEFGWEAVQP